MIDFMRWSFETYCRTHPGASVGSWLVDTALFEQAWSIVTKDSTAWWWSSWICTWTVVYTAVIWFESSRRGIKYRWAYMVLGQLVAISVSTSLFLTALVLHPPTYVIRPSYHLQLLLPLVMAMVCILCLPKTIDTKQFMPVLVTLHLLLLAPFASSPRLDLPSKKGSGRPSGSRMVYIELALLASVIHQLNTRQLLASIPHSGSNFRSLCSKMLSHPAQASISFDVVWVFVVLLVWALTTGSTTSILLKAILAGAAATLGIISYAGISWTLILSTLPIVLLALVGVTMFGLSRVRTRNTRRRAELLAKMGLEENVIVPGTANSPPRKIGKQTIIGFWHPYCNSGGGGERVLWTAIMHLQRLHKETVVLVYTGDYPAASKEAILAKIDDRFSIKLHPQYLQFIPLPSRHLVDDSYWKRFTLLGQSFGSICLAWQGLCGPHGLWGDIFLDSMGYAFTWPFVRFICGSEIAIGAYVHYPTVSSDMVKRVRERSFGIENAGASGSWYKTQIKLIYYHILTSLYATALLFSQYTMANSSWTSAHITSLVSEARRGWLSSLLLMDDKAIAIHGDKPTGVKTVYPPCDTTALSSLGRLDHRKRELFSLAQFRPEKDHAKQIQALAKLFESHPEHRDGDQRVTLTLAGGARHPADEARVDQLKDLARTLAVDANVTFLLNAPYPEIVRRLGEASIGLNTMQDEHFGINVVEFMAAGLIPIVHASAGPLLDIVVPFNGQRTGFHAKTADEFASQIHEALSLSTTQQGKIRRAARAAAEQRFSEREFNKGFEKGYIELLRMIGGQSLLES
ncbi:hypothetical protein BD324DRAFT_617618 [Kockovaella imperatae]|uniref:GDP-Man:Man(3)GlcNAc(2)-PP-Dol alpha-1,2-mannosyltransferase n=1 Tax=Kockovaella imperatae TaxID=4999 RepID=A0A1Y1ULD9_9TREE|nr:hypothetical protein BD324DRAFT_617618 [Kockovaella imperatae]ORX38870.1 hypothetical protein BD324DRAFT_617618 [Kockovaella imperatae]